MSVFWRPRGCVLWLDFGALSGNKVYDLSKQGNHGTIYGAAWRRGHLTGALSFDGVDDYVEVPHSPSLDLGITNRASWELWINPLPAKRDWQDFLTKGGTFSFFTRLAGTTEIEGTIAWTDGTFTYAPLVGLPAQTWSHVVYAWDGTDIKLYVNGAYVDKRTPPPGKVIATTTYDVRIGGVPPYDFFYGSFALVRIYNRALTEREIKAHYHYLTKPMARAPA